MQPVKGRLGQTYLLCRNETIDVKYPRQPVENCPGYDHAHSGDLGAATGLRPAELVALEHLSCSYVKAGLVFSVLKTVRAR